MVKFSNFDNQKFLFIFISFAPFNFPLNIRLNVYYFYLGLEISKDYFLYMFKLFL